MADDDDKPENTPEPEPEPHNEPEHHPENSHEHCDSAINELRQEVSNLRQTVESIIQIKPDTTPVRGPWTHRKFMK